MKVTQNDLNILVKIINKLTNSPPNPYTMIPGGKSESNPLHFYLDYGYGGVSLERICSDGQGASEIFPGHGTKKELYEKLKAYILGLSFLKTEGK